MQTQPGPAAASLEERLERGQLLTFAPCPFPLPAGAALTFLLEQRLKNSYHKNISYNPGSDTVAGLLPQYAPHLQRDRASFRPEEEATRALRLTARNDLLHLDAFPSRPTRGYRILRLFVNLNPSDERVWVTSETFARLLERFGPKVGLPVGDGSNWARRLGQGLLGLFQPGMQERTPYDSPGTAWLAFTDALSHAELRGQYALEHSFFVAPQSLALPEEAPAALLQRACGLPVLPRAA
jgi:hypothetical protein